MNRIVKNSLLAILIFCLIGKPGISQSPIDDKLLRKDAVSRILKTHKIGLNWEQVSLIELMDIEARLDATKRIKNSHGINFNWKEKTLLDLMDIESRIEAAKRISKATKKSIKWENFSLMQLIEMETKNLGIDVNLIKKEVALQSIEDKCKLRAPLQSGSSVYVIAPSVSTSMEARSIRMKNGWVESKLRQADFALVVVRSMLFNPLSYSYNSVKELEEDADNQLNICGDNFHVYIYSIDDDMNVSQEKHDSYIAED